jgi:hypothetical protein
MLLLKEGKQNISNHERAVILREKNIISMLGFEKSHIF